VVARRLCRSLPVLTGRKPLGCTTPRCEMNRSRARGWPRSSSPPPDREGSERGGLTGASGRKGLPLG
jgi:hypothetical protein